MKGAFFLIFSLLFLPQLRFASCFLSFPQHSKTSSRFSFSSPSSPSSPPPLPPNANTNTNQMELILKDLMVLFDRALDTIEDIGVHLRRATERDIQARFGSISNRKERLTKKRSNLPRVVILGTGWGGHAIAKVIDETLYEVVVVSPRNYFLFTPMLAASSVGTVEWRSIGKFLFFVFKSFAFYYISYVLP